MFIAFLVLLYLFFDITKTKGSDEMQTALDLLNKGNELWFALKKK